MVGAQAPVQMKLHSFGGSILLKTATTDRAAFISTVQVLLPEQSPIQPRKVESTAATALSVILPDDAEALQAEPQLMTPPSLVMVPLPEPSFFTLSEYTAGSEGV